MNCIHFTRSRTLIRAFAGIALLVVSCHVAAATLYTVSDHEIGLQFSSIDASGDIHDLFGIGWRYSGPDNPPVDLRYSGGLAYDSDRQLFYASLVEDGRSLLVSFNRDGTVFNRLGNLGGNPFSGLAYDSGDHRLYGLVSAYDSDTGIEHGTLYRFATDGETATALGTVGTGSFAGLTYDARDDRLYTVGSGDWGYWNQLVSIDTDPGLSTTVSTIGDGSYSQPSYRGGLAFDSESGTVLSIAESRYFHFLDMYRFDPTDPSVVSYVSRVGEPWGPGAGGLVAVVPEPASWAQLAGGLVFLLVLRARSRQGRFVTGQDVTPTEAGLQPA